MPGITQHQSARFTKLLLLGHSGSGKTGSLVSLVTAGYKLRILDFDNGIDIIKNFLMKPESPYNSELRTKNIDIDAAVQFCTITEHMKNINGRMMPVKATVWDRAMKMLDHWKDGEIDLGKPANWGDKIILVIDSLSKLSQHGFNWVQMMNGRLGKDSVDFEFQRDMGQAQRLVQGFLELLADEAFEVNVIVISHIAFASDRAGQKDQVGEGVIKGFPEAVGKALLPKIPRSFNNVIQAETVGQGPATKHKLFTYSQGEVHLKSSAPASVKKEYDIATGMAEFFRAVRG